MAAVEDQEQSHTDRRGQGRLVEQVLGGTHSPLSHVNPICARQQIPFQQHEPLHRIVHLEMDKLRLLENENRRTGIGRRPIQGTSPGSAQKKRQEIN
jgi:hypothetical protein